MLDCRQFCLYYSFFQDLDERHRKYKFMEQNLVARKRRLQNQLPDIASSLKMIEKLREKKESNEEMHTQFLLSDQAYANAKIPPTDKVDNRSVPR